jgi:dTDP-4-dehydrorhamnose reductase
VRPLILGAGGTLGQALSAYFKANHISFLGKTRAELDITDTSKILEVLNQFKPNVVFNAAGMTQVDACETKKLEAFAANAVAPGQIASLCRERSIYFVHVSTDFVFDGKKQSPYLEDDPVSPLSVYAESKAEGERLVGKSNADALVVRIAWGFQRGGKSFLSRLCDLILESKRLQIASDRTGNCTYAPDLAEALVHLASLKISGLMHFTNLGELSMYDFAVELKAAAERLGLKPQSEIVPVSGDVLNLPAKRPTYSVLDCSRYMQVTGKQIRHWKETLPEFLLRK